MKEKINKLWFSLKPELRALIILLFSCSIPVIIIILSIYLPEYIMITISTIICVIILVAIIVWVYKELVILEKDNDDNIKSLQDIADHNRRYAEWKKRLENRN